jgi:hypothetical protein
MRPSTRNAIFVALGIAILGAEIGAPSGDAKPPRLAEGALAAIWPSALPLPWGNEATDAEDVTSGAVQLDENSFGSRPLIETGAMTQARRESFTRRAQSHLLAELKDWSL